MAAATKQGSAILFTAITDTYAGQIVCPNGITFQGSGLTPGQRVLLQDDAGETVIDYLVAGATDNADLWTARKSDKFYMGLKFPAGAIAGTWVLTVFLE